MRIFSVLLNILQCKGRYDLIITKKLFAKFCQKLLNLRFTNFYHNLPNSAFAQLLNHAKLGIVKQLRKTKKIFFTNIAHWLKALKDATEDYDKIKSNEST